MTEQDYVKVTNRVKISAALVLIRDCLGSEKPEDDYGISGLELQAIARLLRAAEVKLFSSYETSREAQQ